MTEKIEKLREVKANLATVLNELEVYIFTENIDVNSVKSVDTQKTVVVDEPKR